MKRRTSRRALPLLLAAVPLALVACGSTEPETSSESAAPEGVEYGVRDTVVASHLEAAGVAEAFAEATLSTKLMGTVLDVAVREGDEVRSGQALVRIDARDLEAQARQADAGISEAEAVRDQAATHLERMRALYADEAAPKAQLDAAETSFARAEAGLRTARARAAQVVATADYATIRSPFAGIVTRRFVDAGAFAAPGSPLLTIQDGTRLRITVSAPPDAVRALTRGASVPARVGDAAVSAVVEGVVPAAGGNLYTVNAVVENEAGVYLPGSPASLSLRQGDRRAILIPAAALHREGDLTGVWLARDGTPELRWVRPGERHDGMIEILSGLRPGERVVVPDSVEGTLLPAGDRSLPPAGPGEG